MCTLHTVMAKRIRTYSYFIVKEQMKVKRSNKSRETVVLVSKIQCVCLALYCSNANNHLSTKHCDDQ